MKTKIRLINRHVFLPQDHGSWVFLFSPLLIGLFAGWNWSISYIYLIFACLSGFLIRQPLTIFVKIHSNRRSRRDISTAVFWITIYALIGGLAITGLILTGDGYLLYLAIPGVPVFAWHLYLVSKRTERRQMGVEIVASGVLALAAPAAYWIGIGSMEKMGWLLFVLVWLQSATSIIYAYLRLEQRRLNTLPSLKIRMRMATRTLLYSTFNLIFVILLSIADSLPPFLFVPFSLQWLESIWGSLKPAIGIKPTRIGIRQLIISSLFTLLFISAWYI